MKGPQFVGADGQVLDLVLYKYDACPFCQRVMARAGQLGLALPTRDTRLEPDAYADLVRIGGKSQVPCLVVNGQPLYESSDIIDYLEQRVKRSV